MPLGLIMAKIFVDNIEYEVPDGKNLLEVCLSLGFNLTYFCWHPAMHSVGACRQCGVINFKDENDKRGRLVMSCMQAATNGTRISIEDPRARAFRAGNIEALMLNHPHDCPVCDEGGECHLQDMTVMSGHNYRRNTFKKRTHYNQYLGPFINHEMNRCIQCYRCVRFYNDYAGGKDLAVFAAHDDVYFGRQEEGVLENEFSGNLVEVCPTGVFTDKVLRKHYTRKWDLTSAPSVCHQCSLGCNILTSERYGGIRRILTRYNGDVNGYFICDRGRFGYEYTNSDQRIKQPSKNTDNSSQPLSTEDALHDVKDSIFSKKNIIGIGSPRASLESNFMLKELVGENNFYGGIPKRESDLVHRVISILHQGKVKTPSLKEVESYDAILILGEDVTNTAPMLALAVRQAAKNQPREKAYALRIPQWDDAAVRESVQGQTGPVYLLTTHHTKLDEIATKAEYAAPDDIAITGFEIVQQITRLSQSANGDESSQSFTASVARDLLKAKKPLIISGTSLYNTAIIQAAANIAYSLKDNGKDAGLVYAVPEVNSMGMSMLEQKNLDDAIGRAKEGGVDAVIIAENDLYFRVDRDIANDFLKNCHHVLVLENLQNETTTKADYILPAGTFAESTGTVVNNEGRAQRFYQVYKPSNEMRSSWDWLNEIRNSISGVHAENFDAVVDEMIKKYPELAKVKSVAPDANFRKGTQKIPRETARYSGRTAMLANINVSEPKPPVDKDSPLSFTMEGYQGVPPSPDVPFFWSPGWNSVQSINRYQTEVGGALHGGNPGVRLLEPSNENKSGYFNQSTEKFSRREGEWLVIPFYHIYGSDELSVKGPALAERIPPVYIAMNGKDLEKGNLKDGDHIEITFNQNKLSISVKSENTLPEGIAGLPKGFKETTGIEFPFWGRIRKV